MTNLPKCLPIWTSNESPKYPQRTPKQMTSAYNYFNLQIIPFQSSKNQDVKKTNLRWRLENPLCSSASKIHKSSNLFVIRDKYVVSLCLATVI